MNNIEEELKEAKQKAEEIVAEMKQLALRRQQLLREEQTLIRESLRIDGEIRALKRLNGDKGSGS